ncbi:uncharacterized protein [Saccopteryx bilineata]|uniref:uncharacterized protein n=1 Tax=Saccopteryx bilineata TaxID=59482 RepID=UPI00338F1E30
MGVCRLWPGNSDGSELRRRGRGFLLQTESQSSAPPKGDGAGAEAATRLCAPGGALCTLLALKKTAKSRRLSAVFPASQGELCLKKFQSAEVRLNTMETQNEIALYKKYSFLLDIRSLQSAHLATGIMPGVFTDWISSNIKEGGWHSGEQDTGNSGHGCDWQNESEEQMNQYTLPRAIQIDSYLPMASVGRRAGKLLDTDKYLGGPKDSGNQEEMVSVHFVKNCSYCENAAVVAKP